MKRQLAILTLVMLSLSTGSLRLRAAEGYFRVEQRAGVWWFVAPSGELTLSAGVNNIS